MLLVSFFLGALWEVVWSLICYPIRSYREVPEVKYVPTQRNREIIAQCPRLNEFRACPWGAGCLSQMMIAKYKPLFLGQHHKQWKREVFTLGDGVQVALDWSSKDINIGLPKDAPIIVILHGLIGDSSSGYIQVVSQLCSSRSWRVVAYNRRGYAGMSLLSTIAGSEPKYFPKHVDINDMHEVAMYIRRSFPDAPLFGIGYSTGANLLVRYLSTHKSTQPFKGAVSVSNAHDLDLATKKIAESRPLVGALLTSFMKENLQKMYKDLVQVCESRGIQIDFEKLENAKCVRKLEEALVTSLFGYASLEEYYNNMSSGIHLWDVDIPLLTIGSLDDLIIPSKELVLMTQEAAKQNYNIISVVTQRGSHLAWVEGWRARHWMHDCCIDYLAALIKS